VSRAATAPTQNFPLGHGRQPAAVAIGTGEYFPARQAPQVLAPTPAKNPSVQLEQKPEPLAAANVPTAHCLQELAPLSAKNPAPHSPHTAEDTAPTAALARPAGHLEHSVAAAALNRPAPHCSHTNVTPSTANFL